MDSSPTFWARGWANDLLHRGCPDLTDPERRRQTAVLNVTSYLGSLVCAAFIVAHVIRGNLAFATALSVAFLVMLLSVVIRHRIKDVVFSTWMGVLAVGVLYLYLLARGGSLVGSYVWTPQFPLIAMFCLGRKSGALLTGIYLLSAAAVMLVPALQETSAVSSSSFIVRILIAVLLTAAIAYYYEHSRELVQARLVSEIDERRRIEAELRITEADAVRGSQAKSDFLAALSHEVRTPLTAIMGLNEFLLNSDLRAEQRRYLELSTSAGRSLVAIMQDILDLAKVEAGRLSLQVVPFDLHQLTAEIVELHAKLAHGRPVWVRLDWRDGTPRLVHGDPNRLRQVLTNLTGNALKATARGEVALRVEGTPTTANCTDLMLTVVDTGVGLASELHAHIFEPFAQGEPSATHGGSGLGLAIAKRLVQAMGGEIGVRSTPGEGADFWVHLTLPLADGLPDEPPAVATAFHGRVLVAEDNELNREVLRAMLEQMGCVVQSVANGQEAVDVLRDEQFDLVLMDCQMPVLDGFAATRVIRAQETKGARTPIVAITAYALPEDTLRCEDAGMDGHLAKPLTTEDVVATLVKWLPSSNPAPRR